MSFQKAGICLVEWQKCVTSWRFDVSGGECTVVSGARSNTENNYKPSEQTPLPPSP